MTRPDVPRSFSQNLKECFSRTYQSNHYIIRLVNTSHLVLFPKFESLFPKNSSNQTRGLTHNCEYVQRPTPERYLDQHHGRRRKTTQARYQGLPHQALPDLPCGGKSLDRSGSGYQALGRKVSAQTRY